MDCTGFIVDKRAVYVFQRQLIAWSKTELRDFPWRRTRDPWKILIAEVLLQKTNAEKVVPVYEQFVRSYPTPSSLAGASLEEIQRLLSRIGLIKRAEQLIKAATRLAEEYNDEVPLDEKTLLALPGIGRYTANAVMCLTTQARVPMVDESTGRTLRRIFGLPDLVPAWKDKALWRFAKEIMPRRSCKRYNLALIDFSAKICRAREPNCRACPFPTLCSSWKVRSGSTPVLLESG